MKFNRSALVATGVLLSLAGGTSPSVAGGSGGFVVDTQFWGAPSQVVSSSGPYADCTEVTDVGGGGGPTGVNQVTYSGEKLISCGDDWALIHYDAAFIWPAGRKTHGSWFTLDASSAALFGLHGRLDGDSARCEIQAGSDGCILDKFTVTGR